jgi:hypothetical protein
MRQITDPDKAAAFYDFIRPEIRRMAIQMEKKFRLHDRERGDPFRIDAPYDQLMEFFDMRIAEEIIELDTAMGLLGHPRKPPSVVFGEIADITNFYLMKGVAFDKEWRKGINQPMIATGAGKDKVI